MAFNRVQRVRVQWARGKSTAHHTRLRGDGFSITGLQKNNKMSSYRPQCKEIPIPGRLVGRDRFRGQVQGNRAKGSIDSFSIEMCMTYWMELTNLVIRVDNNPRFRSKRRCIESFR